MKKTLTGTALFLAGMTAGIALPSGDSATVVSVEPEPQMAQMDPASSTAFAEAAKRAGVQGVVTCAPKQFSNRPEPLCYCSDDKQAGWLANLADCDRGWRIAMTKDGKVVGVPLQ